MKNACSRVLPEEGFVRVDQLIAPNGALPIGRTTLWKMIKAGSFPAPIHLAGRRVAAWRVGEVREALMRLAEADH